MYTSAKKIKSGVKTLAVLAGIIAFVAYLVLSPNPEERAVAKVEEAGYTVLDTDRQWGGWGCTGKHSSEWAVQVRDANGVEKTVEVCVTGWNARIDKKAD